MRTPSLDTTVMTSGEPATIDSKSARRSVDPAPLPVARTAEPAPAEPPELGKAVLAPRRCATVRSLPVATPPSESSAVTTGDVCWRSIRQSSLELVTGGHANKSIALDRAMIDAYAMNGPAVVRSLCSER